jgi:hypothetical protein
VKLSNPYDGGALEGGCCMNGGGRGIGASEGSANVGLT